MRPWLKNRCSAKESCGAGRGRTAAGPLKSASAQQAPLLDPLEPDGDIGGARLEIGVAGTGSDPQPLPAARRPHFDVERPRRVETEVACAKLHDAISDAKQAGELFGIAHEVCERLTRLLCLHVLVHLYLIELMDALDAADIAPGGHLFSAKTGRVGC